VLLDSIRGGVVPSVLCLDTHMDKEVSHVNSEAKFPRPYKYTCFFPISKLACLPMWQMLFVFTWPFFFLAT
jgi:hypothetical protein